MKGVVDGRIVAVTGAGNGIGRAHALLFAQEGAKVVVNDLGGARDGTGGSAGPAQAVVDEITAAGGEAVAHTEDISSWEGAESLIQTAIDTFGGIDVVVNNAGILRDRMLTNMSEAEWDAVIKVHLKGTFAPAHFAAAYWREQSKAGNQPDARIINTSSPSGIFGNLGQTNYGAAKAGIAAFTIIAAGELARYGVTVNAIAPTALTRMTEDLGGFDGADDAMKEALAPENISPLVVWLGSAEASGITGRVFGVTGNKISVGEGWVYGPSAERTERWLPGELGEV
ncbi:MAG: SDR family oxidoreductase, partial [Frankiaceae bacterium]|nr:SDR family oxidoreductase [Frankiaceae bacterium]